MNENLGTSFVRTVGWALSSSLIFTILLASPAARSQAVSGAIPGDTGSAGMHSENQCENRGLPNANQLALLRWYSANTVTNVQIGGHPNGAAFDGANVWLVNAPGDSVTKIRANDSAVLGTFAVGYIPGYGAFDGANVWITNLGDNTVTKLRASDGANLGTFPTGKYPWGITFDGSNIWVGNILDNTVSKIRPSDGATLGVFPSGSFPIALAFDGKNIWVTNREEETR
jgi:hypothetical protein